ncbi:hypothetical protein SAMN04488112_10736 [Melghirimyces thermohalophilus]|uniref:Uncharacterized protein n=1 Tax=Melghirimyces thermohalophilus TaxID=1236220 RepID=A0A1G6L495_9BACL|nr:hypothetical protein SAMN04488112_10736 [Melghirimyces thermohalophilus]
MLRVPAVDLDQPHFMVLVQGQVHPEIAVMVATVIQQSGCFQCDAGHGFPSPLALALVVYDLLYRHLPRLPVGSSDTAADHRSFFSQTADQADVLPLPRIVLDDNQAKVMDFLVEMNAKQGLENISALAF